MDAVYMKFIVPAATALGCMLVLLIIRSVAFRILHAWAKRTTSQLDDIIIESIGKPSILFAAAIGLHIGLSFSEIPDKPMLYLGRTLHVLIVLSVTAASATLAGRLFRNYIQQSHIPIPTTGLAYAILKAVVYIIGFLIILNDLGISIAPLITALGVGGLAVALALQDTLANLFAGVHILMEQSVRIGDFVRLESGQEGYVDDITWRSTRVRMLPNNMVVIPNSKLAQSVVTNYSLPDRRMAVQISVGVSYSSDPETVVRVLTDVAKKAAAEVPGLLAEPEPVVRFMPGFGESSLDFTVACHVREFADQYTVQHELRKRIFSRFKEERIDMPFPTRTVYVKEEKDGEK